MRAQISFIMASLLSLSLSSCYVETVEKAPERTSANGKNVPSKPDINSGDQTDLGLTSTGECRKGKTTGCFIGYVPAAPEIRVDGKQFFDAANFAQRFNELITVKSPAADSDAKVTVEVTLNTILDNRNYSQGFEVFIKGPQVKTQRVGSLQSFAFHELPQGVYDIRVQKPLSYTITKTTLKADADGKESEAKEVGTFCAVLYANSSFELNKNEMSKAVFDEFALYTFDKQCETADLGHVIPF